MDNAISTSFASAPVGAWAHSAPAPRPVTDEAAGTLDRQAPPSLDEAPAGSRAGALVLALAVYGGLLGAGLALALGNPVKAAPPRTVALVLESEEGGPPPPPPAGPASTATGSGGAAAPAPVPIPERSTEAVLPVLEPAPATAGTPGQGQPVGGVAGGQPSGAPGGVTGGQVGGTVGGQLGAIAPPRFDAVYLQNPEPEYPGLSRRLGEEGRVVLRVLVNADGLPEQVEVRQSSGHPRLDQAALATVKRWRFTPARRGSERLSAWVLVPLSFQLDA